MTLPQVCILTAGRGTRMGEGFAWINKALLPLEDRAVLSHIIDACPQGTEFVIGLGHLGDQVRAYLELAHPSARFTFVEIEPWHGPRSGPGRSLRCCAEHLRGPFVFVPCDFVPGSPIETTRPGNWVGVSRVQPSESAGYCNFEIDAGRVLAIRDKARAEGDDWRAFTGLMRIEDAATFWAGIDRSGEVAGECQVSGGLGALLDATKLDAIEHAWIDVGDEGRYRSEVVRRHGYDFSKPGEALYLVGRRVVKLFADQEASQRRVERGRAGVGVFPTLLDTPAGFLAYDFVEGETFYSQATPEGVDRLMHWCEAELWVEPSNEPGIVHTHDRETDSEDFVRRCDAFYRVKTSERVRRYAELGGFSREPQMVMGRIVPTANELMDAIDWNDLARGGRAVRFHGDLQFDNVLVRPDGGFTLLDWRQDFAGSTRAGDLDYDLAKMLGGVRVNYARVKRGELAYEIEQCATGDDARFDLPRCRHAEEISLSILRHAARMGRDPRRVRLLTGLIHLNMAPLHAEPFGSALRDLARLELAAELVLA